MRALTRLGVRVLAQAYRRYHRTLTVRILMPNGSTIAPDEYPFGSEIFALCERDAFALAGITASLGFTVLVAHGKDGDWASAALETIGCRVVRGSTARGGSTALWRLATALRRSARPVAVVVDGPLGPSGQAKPGAIGCAQRARRPLRPLGAAARRRIEFTGAWSRIYLPLPFTTVHVVCDAPMHVPSDGGHDAVASATGELTTRLATARARALALATQSHARDTARRHAFAAEQRRER